MRVTSFRFRSPLCRNVSGLGRSRSPHSGLHSKGNIFFKKRIFSSFSLTLSYYFDSILLEKFMSFKEEVCSRKRCQNLAKISSLKIELFSKNIIFQVFYEQLIERLEKIAAKGERPKNMVNLLSMDGGGIRGLVILQVHSSSSNFHLSRQLIPDPVGDRGSDGRTYLPVFRLGRRHQYWSSSRCVSCSG